MQEMTISHRGQRQRSAVPLAARIIGLIRTAPPTRQPSTIQHSRLAVMRPSLMAISYARNIELLPELSRPTSATISTRFTLTGMLPMHRKFRTDSERSFPRSTSTCASAIVPQNTSASPAYHIHLRCARSRNTISVPGPMTSVGFDCDI